MNYSWVKVNGDGIEILYRVPLFDKSMNFVVVSVYSQTEINERFEGKRNRHSWIIFKKNLKGSLIYSSLRL